VVDQSPPLPPHYVARTKEEQRLQESLLSPESGPGVVVSAVFGLGGIGKSTLVAKVVQLPQVQDRFSDGVLWVTLGQNPELLSLVGQWIRGLGDHDFRALDLHGASERLRQLLRERAVLLVVDDAWSSEHVEPFRVGGPRCRLLVTTRDNLIARAIGASLLDLDQLTPAQAETLFVGYLERDLQPEERKQADQVARAVGCLPLALELAAAQVADGLSWAALLADLESEVARLESLDQAGAEEIEGEAQRKRLSLTASLNLSLTRLPQRRRNCLAWIGVLADDAPVNEEMAAVIWQMESGGAREMLQYLRNKALLLIRTSRPNGTPTFAMHDLIHDSARRLLTAPTAPTSPGNLPGLGLEMPQAHTELLRRYRSKTRGGYWHTLAADGYIHGRLGWHLERAGDIEGLHALLREETVEGRNGWYEANERLGQASNFVECVAQAWRLVDEAFRQGRPALGLQCRCALLSASLNSLARNLPPALLEALVHQRLWPMEQGLAYARRTPSAKQKVVALARLAELALLGERAEVLSEALDAACSIGDEGARSEALVALAPNLPGELLRKGLDAAGSIIESEWARSEALAALAPHLPAELLREALDAARSIGIERARSRALVALARHLPEPGRSAVLREALDAARSIGDEGVAFYWALAALAPHLPAELLREALDAARSIGDEGARSGALAILASHLPEGERAAVLREALDAARSIGDKGARYEALAILASHLPERERTAVLREALDAARSIRNEWARSRALASLASHLPAELLREALDAARSIGHEGARSGVLTALALHLPAELLGEALDAARSIEEEEPRSEALAALAPRLAALPLRDLSTIWTQTLPVLVARTRRNLIVDFLSLVPVLAALAGSNAATELREVARAIQDVGRWWP
jgi:hypothetical protein